MDYNLIEEAGKLDAPGRPMTYKTSKEFLKTFGISSLKELPELPRYKLDENRQIVIDEKKEENPDPDEVANDAEYGGGTPEIMEVSDVVASATEGIEG